jgi:hypothetical protein
MVYDDGNRVAKTVAGVLTRYQFATLNPTGYTQMVGEELPNGYPVVTDVNGTVTDTYDYDAFGNLIHSTGTSLNNYLFAGEQFDPDLNLYYNRQDI